MNSITQTIAFALIAALTTTGSILFKESEKEAPAAPDTIVE